ncbi:MAG: guanylate kinase [Bacteroidetes bacterium]|nr:guanylate kinase [Bacteroidota bacterium]
MLSLAKKNWNKSGNRYKILSNTRGKIIILTAPSGAGKSTMAKRLLRDFSSIRFSVSATTRPPRPGEVDGVDYHFLTKKQFKEKIERNEFLEWETFYNGTMYGTLEASVEYERNKGYFVMLDVDVLGALNVKKTYGEEAMSIFISPPSISVLEQRLRSRATESDETLLLRLDRAKREIKYAHRFDVEVVNDDLESAYKKIKSAVELFITNSKS